MSVRIDDARGDDQAGRVDLLLRRLPGKMGDAGDPAVADADIGPAAPAAIARRRMSAIAAISSSVAVRVCAASEPITQMRRLEWPM